MTRIRFEDLPSTNTPRNAENLNKLNNVVISSIQPTTGEEVWIDNIKRKVYIKKSDETYEEFFNTVSSIFEYDNESYLINDWKPNGNNKMWVDADGVKHLQLAVRYGTSNEVMVLPEAMRPMSATIIPVFSYDSIGYALIGIDGKITKYGGVENAGDLLINVSYI